MLPSPLSVFLVTAIAAATTAAQPATPQDGTAAAPQSVGAATSLTVELNALHAMIDAMGNAKTNSEDRIDAMNAYMKEKNLSDGLSDFTSKANLPTVTSFLQGYQASLATERLNGTPAPASTDLGLLAREVSASTTQAHSAWDGQNSRFQQVAVMSAYLQSKNEFVGYQKWAPGYAAAKRKAQVDRYKAANDALNAQQQVYLKHIDEMHEAWDKVPHGTGLNFNYGFSQGNGPNEGGTGQVANTGGTGVDAPYAQGANTPWSYAGAQGGFYAGAYGAGSYNAAGGAPPGNDYNVNMGNLGVGGGGYYNGTNYNSYSDVYPDLYGYPAGTDFGANGFNAAGINHIWDRARDSNGPPMPNGLGQGAGGAGDRGAAK